MKIGKHSQVLWNREQTDHCFYHVLLNVTELLYAELIISWLLVGGGGRKITLEIWTYPLKPNFYITESYSWEFGLKKSWTLDHAGTKPMVPHNTRV